MNHNSLGKVNTCTYSFYAMASIGVVAFASSVKVSLSENVK